MRIGICEWTTFPASFDDELAAYRAAGAGAIGVLEFKVAADPDWQRKLHESGLAASACMPAAGSILPSPLIPGPDEPEARVESICESVARLAPARAVVRVLPHRGRRGRRGRARGDPADRRGGRARRCAGRAGADPSVAGGRALVRAHDRGRPGADRRRAGRDPVRHVALAGGRSRRPDLRRSRRRPPRADALGLRPAAAGRRIARRRSRRSTRAATTAGTTSR